LNSPQYTSVRFGETLMLAGLIPSIGSVGDAYGNALAETTIGLYKTEAVCKDSPFRTGPLDRLADVELLTADWVHWYNDTRLMHRLGRTPPGGIRRPLLHSGGGHQVGGTPVAKCA